MQAAFEACGGDLGSEGVCRRLAGLVGDQFDALQQAAAADVADLFVSVAHAGQPCRELLAENVGPFDEVVPVDDGEHGQSDGCREGIRHMCGEEEESSFMADGLDLLTGDHGGHRQTRAQGLRQCQQVWDDPVLLMRIHQSSATDPGLCLVDDQQHVALDTEFLEPAQVPQRWFDDPAGGQDRLDETRRQAAG